MFFRLFVFILCLHVVLQPFSVAYASGGSTTKSHLKHRSSVASVQRGRININTADVEMLTALQGIGEKKAQAIIDYRNANGPFKSLKQLEEVKGIGPATVAKNRGAITLK